MIKKKILVFTLLCFEVTSFASDLPWNSFVSGNQDLEETTIIPENIHVGFSCETLVHMDNGEKRCISDLTSHQKVEAWDDNSGQFVQKDIRIVDSNSDKSVSLSIEGSSGTTFSVYCGINQFFLNSGNRWIESKDLKGG